VFAAGCSLSGGTGTGQAGNEQQQQSDEGNGSEIQEPDLEKESEKGSEEEPEEEETLTVMVYFGDFQSEKVAPETRTVKVKAGDSIEKVVFEELAKVPKQKDWILLFPRAQSYCRSGPKTEFARLICRKSLLKII